MLVAFVTGVLVEGLSTLIRKSFNITGRVAQHSAQSDIEPFGGRRAGCYIRNGSDMNHSEIASFIWGVADLIRDTFKRGKYQDVILVSRKAPPRLRRRTPMANHVLGYGSLGNGDAELREFTVHAGSSPERIGSTHVPDQLPYFGSDAGSTLPLPPALPCPVAFEPRSGATGQPSRASR